MLPRQPVYPPALADPHTPVCTHSLGAQLHMPVVTSTEPTRSAQVRNFSIEENESLGLLVSHQEVLRDNLVHACQNLIVVRNFFEVSGCVRRDPKPHERVVYLWHITT